MSLAQPEQLLPVEAYRSPAWFEREQREIFSRCWTFAALESDLTEAGAFRVVPCGPSSLIVLRDQGGGLRAFHNICRHRGTELLEGCGKLGRTIVCPYHRWTYSLEGALMGMPEQKACFPDIDKAALGLHPAALACLKGMVFVHPDAAPEIAFEDWVAELAGSLWPHDFAEMTEGPPMLYEARCNWKIFFENAIDGYHLAFLHEKTLGGPPPLENVWERHGRHMLWYATETGRKSCLPSAVAEEMARAGAGKIKGAESGDYAGVCALYPSTLVTPSPYEFSVTTMIPLRPDLTRIRVRGWGRRESSWFGGAPTQPRDGAAEPEAVRLEALDKHPLESGDFMLEDLWVCEKIQKSMASRHFSVGALARGAGCESPLAWFQSQVLADLGDAA